jgi:hypothetical protein
MRLGCGCLLATLLLIGSAVGLAWAAYRSLQRPDLAAVSTSAEDGRRAQEKIYEISKRLHGERSTRQHGPVVLTEGEVNAFLARHLVEAADVPLSEFRVRLGSGERADVAVRTRLQSLVAESPLGALATAIPSRWLDRPAWISLGCRVRVEVAEHDRRYLRLDPEEFAIGRQPLPAFLARLVLDPGTVRFLRWRLPAGIEDVRVEQGRAVVRTAS